MVFKVVTFLWLGHLHPQKCSTRPSTHLDLHNYRNNKCDFINHYFGLTATTDLIVINLISPNNKDKHQVQLTCH
jgi:hypothetical protein